MSAIPPSPSLTLDMEECHQDDCDIPIVPITSIEDEGPVDTLFDLAAPLNNSMISKPPTLSPDLLASGTHDTSQCNRPDLEPPAIEKPALGMSPGVEADIIAAATASITMVMKCKGQGSLIDTDLLIKILTNPKMTEKLINDCQAPGGVGALPLCESNPVTQSVPLSCSEPNTELEPRPANENICYQPNRVQPAQDSRSFQEDTFPVSRSKRVAYQVPLPCTGGNICSLSSDMEPALNSSPLQPDIFSVSCSKLVTCPVPLPCREPDIVMLSKPSKVNIWPVANDVQPAINSRPPWLDTAQFSGSKPANGNMYSLVDEVLVALNSKASTFVQSHAHAHAELMWLLSSATPIGWLNKMIQLKEKSWKVGDENVGVSFLTYPVLMASNFLLCQLDFVSIGEDQKQHLELTCELAERVNYLYGRRKWNRLVGQGKLKSEKFDLSYAGLRREIIKSVNTVLAST